MKAVFVVLIVLGCLLLAGIASILLLEATMAGFMDAAGHAIDKAVSGADHPHHSNHHKQPRRVGAHCSVHSPPGACGPGAYCNTKRNQCMRKGACVTTSDCDDPTGEQCLGGGCVPRACSTSADCKDHRSSEPIRCNGQGACVLGCDSDGQCGPHGICGVKAPHVCHYPSSTATTAPPALNNVLRDRRVTFHEPPVTMVA